MFRFIIRDVLWLMVVVGLVCAWLIEHRRAARTQAAMAEREAVLSKDIKFAEVIIKITGWEKEWAKRHDPPIDLSRIDRSSPATATVDLLYYPPKQNEM